MNAVFNRCTWQHLHHRLHIQPCNHEDFTWLVCNVWCLARPNIRRVFITDPDSMSVLGFDPHAPQQKERGAAIAALEDALS
ncbi:MAG: hypothetical protein F6J87_12685 [Spirulina sp. SIO3F2]|nr:hypothetical protein [Spirulina sp. SIO3F2]